MSLPLRSRQPARRMSGPASTERGASLIEVLVAVLLLSFGLLALGGILTYTVTLPKLSANRAVAQSLANDLVERMRANKAHFMDSTDYNTALTFDGTNAAVSLPVNLCTHPNCTSATIATLDVAAVSYTVRKQLPGGGIQIDDLGSTGSGRVWVLWNEPDALANLAATGSDQCPTLTVALQAFKPRCLLVNFQL